MFNTIQDLEVLLKKANLYLTHLTRRGLGTELLSGDIQNRKCEIYDL